MSANIEELSEKHAKECAYAAHDKIGLYPQDQMWVFNAAKSSIRNALTEQAEAFKGELQAYDGMVRELTKTVEDMRAAQSVPVVGEPVAFEAGFEWARMLTGHVHDGRDVCRTLTAHFWPAALRGIEVDGMAIKERAIVQAKAEIMRRLSLHAIPAAELATLREKAARLEHELETERMRLAACGVIAMANTVDSAAKARDMLPEYWSASAQDCASAVDREMDYRSRLVVAERERDELRKDAAVGAAIQRAAKELPDGYDLHIQAESGSVSVSLYLPDTDGCIEFDIDDNNRLAAEVEAAIDAAIAQGKGE